MPAFSGLVLGIVSYFYSAVNLWYKPDRKEPKPRETKAMVLISRTPPATSDRHYRPSFELTEAERRPTPPKPAPPPPVAVAPPAAPSRPAPPPRPVRTVVIAQTPRKPYTRKPVETVRPDLPRAAPKRPATAIGAIVTLDSAQRESLLEALDMREHLIDGDLMREVKLLVEGKITNISMTPTDTERRIFRLLRVPGFE